MKKFVTLALVALLVPAFGLAQSDQAVDGNVIRWQVPEIYFAVDLSLWDTEANLLSDPLSMLREAGKTWTTAGHTYLVYVSEQTYPSTSSDTIQKEKTLTSFGFTPGVSLGE